LIQVFSPQETIDNPLILHLIFCQIVKDAHSSTCIRLTQEEKFKLQSQLQSHGINTSNIYSSSPKLQAQKSIIDFARELPTYFCRLYPVSGGRNLPNVHLLGVSHSGVRLIQRERDAMCDYLKVLDKLRYTFNTFSQLYH
jgi:myosin-15